MSKKPLEIVAAVLAALICEATGAAVLWFFHTTPGLFVGVGLILLGLAIALPTPFHAGILTFKSNAQELGPLVDGFVGRRASDRRDDGSVVVVPKDLPAEPPGEVT